MYAQQAEQLIDIMVNAELAHIPTGCSFVGTEMKAVSYYFTATNENIPAETTFPDYIMSQQGMPKYLTGTKKYT